MALGREEGAWRLRHELECLLSDHVYLVVERDVAPRAALADRRPLPVTLKKGSREREAFVKHTEESLTFAGELYDAATAAGAAGGVYGAAGLGGGCARAENYVMSCYVCGSS
jgi:hypothetical protein